MGIEEEKAKKNTPGEVAGQDTLVLGNFLRDLDKLNQQQRNFRIFGPDKAISNLLQAVFEVPDRQWHAQTVNNDEFLAPYGSGQNLADPIINSRPSFAHLILPL